MSNRRIPIQRTKRKTKKPPPSSAASDSRRFVDSQAAEDSIQDDEPPFNPQAAPDNDPGSQRAKQAPRARTFSFRDTLDDMSNESAEADDFNEPPSEDAPDENPKQNLLPLQATPYVPADEGSCRVDHNAPEFAGTEEAAAYQYYADEDDEAADNEDADETEEDRPQPEVTVRRLMNGLRELGGVWVSCVTRPITDNGDQAIVLSQILYWFDDGKQRGPRARVFKNGRRWFYKTHEEFAKETGLTPRRVKDCLRALKDKGYIEIEYFLADGRRTSHIGINVQTVYKALCEVVLRRKNAGRTKSVPR